MQRTYSRDYLGERPPTSPEPKEEEEEEYEPYPGLVEEEENSVDWGALKRAVRERGKREKAARERRGSWRPEEEGEVWLDVPEEAVASLNALLEWVNSLMPEAGYSEEAHEKARFWGELLYDRGELRKTKTRESTPFILALREAVLLREKRATETQQKEAWEKVKREREWWKEEVRAKAAEERAKAEEERAAR